MRIADMNWMQVQRPNVAKDDRLVIPIGSTEQHAFLSLCVDAILSSRVAEAAEPLNVPVFAVIGYGLAVALRRAAQVTLRFSPHWPRLLKM